MIALAFVALVWLGCSDDPSGTTNKLEEDPFSDLAVCSPEEHAQNPRTCIPEEKAAYYADLWKAEFKARNGIDEEYFNTHVSSVSTGSLCWNSGVTFIADYRLTIDWAVVDRRDKIVVMLYSSENAYRYLNIPRDVFLEEPDIDLILDNGVFESSVGPVVPLESLPYASCADAVRAFQDSVQSSDILPTRIAYYVPGKIPREDGYPYFIGRGEVDPSENICIDGYFNLFTGEAEAWLTACVVE